MRVVGKVQDERLVEACVMISHYGGHSTIVLEHQDTWTNVLDALILIGDSVEKSGIGTISDTDIKYATTSCQRRAAILGPNYAECRGGHDKLCED